MTRLSIHALAGVLCLSVLAVAAPKGDASKASEAKGEKGGVVGTFSGPVILKHTPPEKAEREKELVLRANIIAPAGAYLPTLYYRPVGEQRFYSLPMLQVPGSLNIYAASVPGIFVTNDLEYYLESYDTQLRGPGSAGSQKNPIKVPVVDPEVPPSQVVVRSDPNGASLKIDGKDVGPTPWIGMLPPGSHELLFKKDGFLETSSTLDVPEGRDLDTLRVLPPAAEAATFAVTSEPTGATVTIDGQVLGQTPLIAPSPDGQHTLSVEKQGFARAERTMLFSKERSIETSFTLEKLPPEPALAVTSEPPGAKVTVDGKDLGKTPFIGVVPAGDHTLELHLDGRRPAQAQIIMPEDRDLDLRFTLEEAKVQRTPMLAVSSDPENADLAIDGQPVGKSPYINELKAGPHTIKLSAPGFQPYEKKISMPDTNDIEITLALVPLPPPPGPSKIVINAEPADVEILVDGKSLGKAPANLELPAGPHVATAKKDGFRTSEERFTVVQGQGVQMKLSLQPVPKNAENPLLSIKTDVDGANVLIDGKAAGQTPYSAQLPPGAHKLVVAKDGFKPRIESFELPKDKAFELRYGFTLEPLRKSVSLASAADLKKEQEKPQKPIIDPKLVAKERKDLVPQGAQATGGSAAATTADPKTAEALQKQAELAKKLQKQAQSLQKDLATPRYGPFILAGLGVVSAGVGVLFALQSENPVSDLSSGPAIDATGRNQLVAEHTRDVQAAVGLTLGGAALAAVGAVWASWPRHVDVDAGSGGEMPSVRFSAAPVPGGAAMGVNGSF